MPPPPNLALTIGDINGIGPEVALKSALQFSRHSNIKIVLVGPAAAFLFWAARLGISQNFFQICRYPDFFVPNSKKIVIFEAVKKSAARIEMGKPTKVSGQIAAVSIKAAVNLALARKVDAIVTAPISKEALHKAGYDFPGHTEMLAHLGNVEKPVMLMVSGRLRVAVATTHLALQDVPKALSADAIFRTVEVLAKELKGRFQIPGPRIAVAGLNPHAGEGGVLAMRKKSIFYRQFGA